MIDEDDHFYGRKAVFLDRDGTINEDHGYIYRSCDFVLLPGVVDALRILQEMGYLLIVITNQSGIARGYYSESDYKVLSEYSRDLLARNNVFLTDEFYCPHLPNAKIKEYCLDCKCRKPRTGMFEEATDKYNIVYAKSYAIGDRIRDCSICFNTECSGFLVGETENEEIIEKVKAGTYSRIAYAPDLLTCAMSIRNKVCEKEE